MTVGDWIDRLGPEGSPAESRSFLYTRTLADTTLRFSAISQGEAGDDGLRIEVTGPDGTLCQQGTAIRQLDARDVVGVQANASVEEDCGAPGDYVVTVSRRLADERTVGYGLRVAEEPPVEQAGALAADDSVDLTPPRASGAAREAVGGSSSRTGPRSGPAAGPARWSESRRTDPRTPTGRRGPSTARPISRTPSRARTRAAHCCSPSVRWGCSAGPSWWRPTCCAAVAGPEP